MAEGRQRDNWAHTSSILALTANCNRDPKKQRAFTPNDFDPFAVKEKNRKSTMSLEEMKMRFLGKYKKK
jgi:hypothetical protein